MTAERRVPSAMIERVREIAAHSLGLDLGPCIMVNGWQMDATSATLIGFGADRRGPQLIVKLGRGPGRARVVAEHRNLLALEAGDAAFRASVPAVVALQEQGGTVLLFESAVPGWPLAEPVPARSLGALSLEVTDWTLAFHRATGAGSALGRDQAEATLLAPFADYLTHFQPAPEEAAFLERMRRQAEALARDGVPALWRHGDLCPPNIVCMAPGQLGVIDWEEARPTALPAYDLIHFFSCLGFDAAPSGPGLGPFEAAFFADTRLSMVASGALRRYAAAIGLESDALRILFTLYWLEYALEKLALEPAAPAAASAGGPAVFSLAQFDAGTCANLRWLAHNETRLVLP